MKRGFTDIHHHLLYGLDDGAQSEKEMHAMLRRAHDEGIVRIVATPHVTPGVQRFDVEQYARALEEARAYCAEKELPMEIYAGAEILYTDQTCRFLQERRAPTMADTEYVLVEFSPDVRFERLYRALAELQGRGYLPIVAHTERYQCLTRHPSRIEELKREIDVYYQVNCATIIHQKSIQERHFIKKMLDWDMIDCIATDAHRATKVRVANMRDAWETLRDEFGSVYANELTDGRLIFGK